MTDNGSIEQIAEYPQKVLGSAPRVSIEAASVFTPEAVAEKVRRHLDR